MGWKSVELQVALPRSQDAGKQQEQMSKQNQHFQESLAQSQFKSEQKQRTTVTKFEELTNRANQDEKKEQQTRDLSNDQEQNERKTLKDKETFKHPYLGSNIDYIG